MEGGASAGSYTNVAELMGRLNLTAEENDALAVDVDTLEG